MISSLPPRDSYEQAVLATEPHWAFVGPGMIHGIDSTGKHNATVEGTLEPETPGVGNIDATLYNRAGYLNLPDGANVINPTGWALAFWAKTTSRGQRLYLENGVGGDIQFLNPSNNNHMRLWRNSVSKNVYLFQPANNGEWYFFAATQDDTATITYCVNGNFSTTGGQPNDGPYTNPSVLVGEGGGETWRGSMALAAGWKRSLTRDEMTHLYLAGINGVL